MSHNSGNQPAGNPVHIYWNGVGMAREDCSLACALTIWGRFQDGTRLDDTTIGEIIASTKGVQNVNITGLVEHLRLTGTGRLYPDVLARPAEMTAWARDTMNSWQDRYAAPDGQWP